VAARGATIAFDARLVGYAAGIARYAVLLAEALAKLDGPESYLLLRGRKADPALGGRLCLTPPHHPLERFSLPVELLASPQRPDLLHSLDHVAPAWGPWRSVVTLHDLAFLLYPETHTQASRRYYAAAGESARRAARVIAVSERTRVDAHELYGIPLDHITVTPHGVDPAFSPGDGHRGDYLLFVGAVQARKEPLRALDAADAVGLPLVVAGPLKDLELAARLRDAGARLRGYVEKQELADLYRGAAAVLLLSRYEGFGLPVLEAMACGTPVVISDDEALREVAGNAAIVASDGEAAAAVRRALAERAQLAAAGIERARAFTWAEAARRTAEVYRSVLAA
jgi:glycosyltransferase involved in cell wall biosynthesis